MKKKSDGNAFKLYQPDVKETLVSSAAKIKLINRRVGLYPNDIKASTLQNIFPRLHRIYSYFTALIPSELPDLCINI